LLASSEVAVRFAIVDKTGAAIGDKATFFFGSQVENLGAAERAAIVCSPVLATRRCEMQRGAVATSGATVAAAAGDRAYSAFTVHARRAWGSACPRLPRDWARPCPHSAHGPSHRFR
jgi:hypothetical protein